VSTGPGHQSLSWARLIQSAPSQGVYSLHIFWLSFQHSRGATYSARFIFLDLINSINSCWRGQIRGS
jgi:hypothetical protein